MGRHPINSLGIVPILLIRFSIFRNAFLLTVRSMSNLGTRTIFTLLVMVTGCQLIRIAIIRISIEPAGHNSLFVPMVHGSICMAPATAISTQSTTTQHVRSRNSSLKGLVAVDTNPIRYYLNCSQSPARTAVTLISDFSNGLTLRPSLG